MAEDTIQDIHFPKAGISVSGPYGRQPVIQDQKSGEYWKTAVDGENVRSWETLTRRNRGGSRAGLTQYIPATVLAGTTWIVQTVNVLATTEGSVPPVQQSTSGRVVYLVAVSQGTVVVATAGATAWTATINNSGETPPLNITGVMQSAPNNQKLWFADGTNYVYYNPPTNSIEPWVASVGALPRDSLSNGGRLITTWRGRTVLSGLLEDPQNWFMSRVSDPTDFDYFAADNDVQQATAGNNSPLGLIGDVITALIPYTDDILVFGGNSSIYAMKGDPQNGGSIDLVSDITGIAFGKAWCKDPYGNIYFFGSKPSVWVMSATNAPTRISQPIEPLIQNINTGTSVITMAWDDNMQAIELFITAEAAPQANMHLTWEYRSNSWWPRVFANTNHDPLCCVAYDGNLPGDRAVLIGSWDGFVRFLDPTATSDDGTAIASYVLLGPIMTSEMDEMLLYELQMIMAEASGQVTYSVLAGSTAEAALANAPAVTGTALAGRNNTQPIRVAQHAIYIKISAMTQWAMEAVRARFAGRGKVRQRNKGKL